TRRDRGLRALRLASVRDLRLDLAALAHGIGSGEPLDVRLPARPDLRKRRAERILDLLTALAARTQGQSYDRLAPALTREQIEQRTAEQRAVPDAGRQRSRAAAKASPDRRPQVRNPPRQELGGAIQSPA